MKKGALKNQDKIAKRRSADFDKMMELVKKFPNKKIMENDSLPKTKWGTHKTGRNIKGSLTNQKVWHSF